MTCLNINKFNVVSALICINIFAYILITPALAQEGLFDTTIENALDRVEKKYYPSQIENLEVKGEDIQDVLRTISQLSGLNILATEDIQGKVTIFLKNVEARDALRIILDTQDLAFSEDGQIIRVMTAQEFKERYGYSFQADIQTKIIPLLHTSLDSVEDVLNEMKSLEGKIISNEQTNTIILLDDSEKLIAMERFIQRMDVPIDTVTFELKHIKPVIIVNRIKSLLTDNIGEVEVNNELRQVIVTDNRSKIEEFRKIIESLDQVEREINVSVKVLQIILNDEHTDGVDWEAIVSNFQKLEFLGLKNAIEGKDGNISLGTVTQEDYKVLLEALDTVGDINEIHTQKNVAKVDQEMEIIVNGLDAVSFKDGELEMESKDRDEDVRFYVNLKGREDDNLILHIKPEVFSLAEKSITMNVEDGSTAVIGGLFKEVTVERNRKIPLLGDIPLIRDVPFSEIPLLGFAFRNQKRKERDTEIIVFLTTQIIEIEQGDE